MKGFAPRTKVLILAGALCLLALPIARATTHSAATSVATIGVPTPTVKTPAAFGTSARLSTLGKAQTPTGKGVPLQGGMGERENEAPLSHPLGDGTGLGLDAAVQQSSGSGIPPTGNNFEGNDIGESSSDGVFVGGPPERNGAEIG